MTKPFRLCSVPLHWLPANGSMRDRATGFYAIARRADGTLEACTYPGLWYTIAPEAQARFETLLDE